MREVAWNINLATLLKATHERGYMGKTAAGHSSQLLPGLVRASTLLEKANSVPFWAFPWP